MLAARANPCCCFPFHVLLEGEVRNEVTAASPNVVVVIDAGKFARIASKSAGARSWRRDQRQTGRRSDPKHRSPCRRRRSGARAGRSATATRPRRQRLDADIVGPGALHDDARTGDVLWRARAEEECRQRAHAMRFLDGADDRIVGHGRIHAGIWWRQERSDARRLDRQYGLPVHGGSAARVGQRRSGHAAVSELWEFPV